MKSYKFFWLEESKKRVNKMALQYFLQEGVEGAQNLKTLYKELNNEFFGGSLPTIPVKWSGRLKRAIGQASCKYKRNSLNAGKATSFEKYMKEIPIANVEINMSSLFIKLSTAFDLNLPDVKAVMLHEMVHIKLYTQKKLGGHHDTPEFDGWIRKLSDLSGLKIPFKETEFKKSPKLQAKEGYLILLILMNGTFGITSYSKNFLMSKWLLFSQRMTEIPSLSSKIQRLYGYKISHPIVGTMTGKRSIKGISWSTIDEETAEEIKKGKLFLSADKEGGTLIPRVLGVRDDEFDLSGELQFKKGKLINLSKNKPEPEPEPVRKKKQLSADDIALLKARGGTGRVTTKRYGY